MDDRGSKLQTLIYNLTEQAYPKYDVAFEYPIGELRQRIDIFIPILGIAIEVHGEQHYNFVSYFHKDELAWNYSVHLDQKKVKYLTERGVKIVEIPFNTKIKTKEELIALIDSIPYPDAPYDGIEEKSIQKRQKLEQQKNYRKIAKENRSKYDY